jgi:hypothetical protein
MNVVHPVSRSLYGVHTWDIFLVAEEKRERQPGGGCRRLSRLHFPTSFRDVQILGHGQP